MAEPFRIEKQPPNTLSKLKVVNGQTLLEWGRFKAFEEVSHQLEEVPIIGNKIIRFISHRWLEEGQPDPHNHQYSLIQSTIDVDEYYWFDYSCMPQNKKSSAYQEYTPLVLRNLNEIVRRSEVIILRSMNDDYFTRGWCFHEWFNAQYLGFHGRMFLTTNRNVSFENQIVEAKFNADRLLCGDWRILDSLVFGKNENEDRPIITELTQKAVIQCQKKITETCIEVVMETLRSSNYGNTSNFQISIDDLWSRFERLVRFIKIWAHLLQPVEPVSDRIALYFHKGRWEALFRLTYPQIVESMMRSIYSIQIGSKNLSPLEKEIKSIYHHCELHMPETRHTVIAFLCCILLMDNK